MLLNVYKSKWFTVSLTRSSTKFMFRFIDVFLPNFTYSFYIIVFIFNLKSNIFNFKTVKFYFIFLCKLNFFKPRMNVFNVHRIYTVCIILKYSFNENNLLIKLSQIRIYYYRRFYYVSHWWIIIISFVINK